MRPFIIAGLFLLSPAAGAAEIRTETLQPKPIRVSVESLPEPYATESAQQQPKLLPVPESPTLNVPEGFEVNLFAEVPQARWLALTPDGRVLCTSSKTDTIYLLADEDGDGKADGRSVFADKTDGLNLPFGMAFLNDWFYVGNTDGVVRFPYKSGSKEVEGPPQLITTLPGEGYNQHWTRNVITAPDGGLFVSVGSKSNADIEAPPRAAVTWISADGTSRRLFASGLRNPVGLDVHPATGELYACVNERDKLGDELVPDYFTRVQEGAFYGWPYAYLKPSLLDPRHVKDGKSVRPDLVEQTVAPDVLFEAHSAALGVSFYKPKKGAKNLFPPRYRNGAFVAHRGSWNRSKGVGYKIVYVPFEGNRPAGHCEDFVTGFLVDEALPSTWARPVGVLALPDGSLLFTEDGNGRIYRVSYKG